MTGIGLRIAQIERASSDSQERFAAETRPRTLPLLSCRRHAYTLLAYLLLPALWTHYEHQKGLADAADGDADRAGHSRRSDQCRPGRRQQGRALRHARRRLVSRRSGDAAILDRNRRQRAAGPSLSRRAGQQSLLSRPARGSRVRKAGRPQRRSPPSCAVLEGAGQGEEKRPVWLGAATFDRSVGVSHYTGAITHHIGADIDAERKLLAADLEAAGMVEAKYR